MGKLTRKAQAYVAHRMRRAGVPESEVHEKVKKVGRGLLLTSIMLIVPLVMFDNVPLAVKIALQMGYALLMCGGLLLAFDEDKKGR